MSILGKIKSILAPASGVSPAECFSRLNGGRALLIDVREPDEWAGGVARGALLLPLSDLAGARSLWRGMLAGASGRELLLYCKSGARSGMAVRLLTAEGFRAANAGGFAGWVAAGWPVERGPRAG